MTPEKAQQIEDRMERAGERHGRKASPIAHAIVSGVLRPLAVILLAWVGMLIWNAALSPRLGPVTWHETFGALWCVWILRNVWDLSGTFSDKP